MNPKKISTQRQHEIAVLNAAIAWSKAPSQANTIKLQFKINGWKAFMEKNMKEDSL